MSGPYGKDVMLAPQDLAELRSRFRDGDQETSDPALSLMSHMQ
jgi:hypothetical protein